MTKVLITGASGFVGQALCPVLEKEGFEVVPAVRSPGPETENDFPNAVTGKTVDAKTDWRRELAGVDIVIHLAARVHVMHSSKSDDLENFRDTNVEGTRNLARQAAELGVKRFVYLSSIKVNGERTDDKPFVADQKPNPEDPYAISKWEAERALGNIAEETGLEVVIIRPPLVYGPGVKGNLATLNRVIKKGIPLPLGAVDNRRDFVSIYNLCDLIRVCCLHRRAAGNVFLVSDNESLSSVELIRHLAKGLGRSARLFSVPVGALKFVAGLLGKAGQAERLTGNLQVDISRTQEVLDWKPPLTVAESFRKMFAKG